MRRMGCVFGVVLACMCSGLWAQSSPPAAIGAAITATAPTATPADLELIRRLGDSDPAVRQAAQNDLDKKTWRYLDSLRRIADRATDAEARARVEARIEDIKDDLAVNPPPVSMHLKDASVDDMDKALSKAAELSSPYIPWPPTDARMGQPAEFYTLDATDEPFWQVFLELSRQHGLYLQGWEANRQIMHNTGTGWRRGVISGPLLVVVDNITYTRAFNFQQDGPDQAHAERFSLSGTAAIDPRVKILRSSSAMFSEITDDAGNDLLAQPPNDLMMSGGIVQAALPLNCELRMIEKPGKKIATAKGYIHLLVEVRSATVEIDDAASKVGGSFPVGRFTVKLGNLDAKPGSISFAVSMTDSAGVIGGIGRVVRGQPDETQSVTCALMDSSGKLLHSVRLSAGSSTGAAIGTQYTPPLKFRLSAPTKVKDVKIPFELKDLPLP